MNYVLIIGAKSDIAKSLAHIYAKNGYSLYLAGKDISQLEPFANHIKITSKVDLQLKELDISNYPSHQNFYNSLEPKPKGVIVVSGYMKDQEECNNSWEKTLNTISVNYTGAVSILNIIANDMENKKDGFIVGISSVAGDRGRKANYTYGSSKAAFTAYLSGLRNRLFSSSVDVLTVKPGFVYTKMTKHLSLPAKLTAYPDDVALDIFNAQQNKKDILYTKPIWRYIMLIIKHIPEIIFKRLSI